MALIGKHMARRRGDPAAVEPMAGACRTLIADDHERVG